MGGNSSKASVRQAKSSANYTNGGEASGSVNGASQLPQMVEPLYSGPIHTLCRVGEDSLLSGGADKVRITAND